MRYVSRISPYDCHGKSSSIHPSICTATLFTQLTVHYYTSVANSVLDWLTQAKGARKEYSNSE
jgi:hypothetical protein